MHSKEDYKDFDKVLDEYFDLWDVETKQELKNFMTNAGFHRKRDISRNVTEVVSVHPNQLDYAWQRFKGKFQQATLPVQIFYKEFTYKDRTIRRLIIDSKEIKGKKYRKGQFIPTEEK